MSETETIEKEHEQQELENEHVEETETQEEKEEFDVEHQEEITFIRELKIEQAFIYTKLKIKENDNFNKYTKRHMIRILCEKLKETNTIAEADIAQTVVEGLDGLVKKSYVYQCLDTSFKNPARSNAMKNAAIERKKFEELSQDPEERVGLGSGHLYKDEPLQDFKTDEQLNAEHITATDNNSIHQLNIPDIEEPDVIDQSGGATVQIPVEEYETICKKLEMAEKKLKALKGELPYADCKELVKVLKWGKAKAYEIDEAYKAANQYVYFEIDLRTDELIVAKTDKEQNKKTKKTRK